MDTSQPANLGPAALAAAANEIAKTELIEYVLRTPASERAMARAERVLPLGVASSFQFYEPHPLVMRAGQRRAHGGSRRPRVRRLHARLWIAVRRPRASGCCSRR